MRVETLIPSNSQDQILVLNVLYLPILLDSARWGPYTQTLTLTPHLSPLTPNRYPQTPALTLTPTLTLILTSIPQP